MAVPRARSWCGSNTPVKPVQISWDDAKGFKDTLDFYIRIANTKGKPLIASETCQGSKKNETRTEIVRVSLRELEKLKIGWLAWQLMAGKIVTGRRDRTDRDCRPGDDSVMYFVEKDGRTRPGHEEKECRRDTKADGDCETPCEHRFSGIRGDPRNVPAL